VRRTSESFSSLQKFIYSPWEWVLKYGAKLKSGPQHNFRIVDDSRSRGSLLHGFVESLLEPELDPLSLVDDWKSDGNAPAACSETKGESPTTGLIETLVLRLFGPGKAVDWKEISREQMDLWVESEWDLVLRISAAHYLVRGNEAARSELLYVAKIGVWELVQHLRAAQVVKVKCEERIVEIPFCGGELTGFIDLQVEQASGRLAVIDLKLGGKTSRIEELQKGRHLQLATYGHLVRSKSNQVPHIAYFIFTGGGVLLARNNEFFPEAQVIPPSSGGAADEWRTCWKEFETLWKWRRSQLDQGRVEVTLSKFGPSLEPEHWTISEPDRFSEFRILAGQE